MVGIIVLGCLGLQYTVIIDHKNIEVKWLKLKPSTMQASTYYCLCQYRYLQPGSDDVVIGNVACENNAKIEILCPL